ncbi:IS110 family transposase [Lewinella sp. W8]|uniref:IS110 family transposase n=1 Tax=Lewinella sp. W8 TaxID=2528208 RepID=UPI0010672FA1|nr:IS110 family transposase [Lewinella sp. W8]MTB54004.1 IS110 family transposase [Lewinella sp. W8]
MQVIVLNAGIDISQDHFDAYLQYLFSDRSVKKAGQRRFKNSAKGIASFIDWVGKRNQLNTEVRFTMEATGRYHEQLAYTLFEADMAVSIVLPNRIKHFARSLNQFSKTDAIDAKLIAAYAATHSPDCWRPASPSMRQLREYTRERQRLTKHKTMALNQLHAVKKSRHPSSRTIDRLQEQIALYENQIEGIEQDIAQMRQEDHQLNENVKLLTSIPHIGWLTACIILAETGGFALFESRSQLIKYAGLDIVEKMSGSSINGKGRLSKRGNSHLRSAPYMSAIGACAKDTVFSQTYHRHLEKHGVKAKAVAATLRQLLKVAYGVYKSRQPYNEKVHRLRIQNEVGEPLSPPTVAHSVN